MMSQKIKNIIILTLSTTGLIVFIGNGCSKGLQSGFSDSSSFGDRGPANISGNTTDIEVIPGAKTVSLVYSKEVLDHLSACAGVSQPSERSIAMYEQKKGTISTYGAVDTVTAPMMMAISSIAGEVCQDVIEQEMKTSARIFVGFDMNSSNLVSNSALSDAIRRLALSCWQRPENSFEAETLTNLIQSSFTANGALAQRKTALMLCTSMLSSLDSILN
jgi:hypothetical protein